MGADCCGPVRSKAACDVGCYGRCLSGRVLRLMGPTAAQQNAAYLLRELSIDDPHNEPRETRALRIDDPELKLRRACAFTRPSASVLRDARRTPIACSHEGSRLVDPTIPDPAAAARRLSAVWPNRRGISCSELEARPSGMLDADGPSRNGGEGLLLRPRTSPIPRLGAAAAPAEIMV